MVNRQRHLDDALAKRRARREHLRLDADALTRLNRAREALGLPQHTTERKRS